MVINAPATNLERAILAWGEPMPRWVRLLANACDQASQRVVADRIEAAGFRCSSATVSRLLNHRYGASYAEPERAVLAVYADDTSECPIFGPIPLAGCIRNRRRKHAPTNSVERLYAATCPTCPCNTDGRSAGED